MHMHTVLTGSYAPNHNGLYKVFIDPMFFGIFVCSPLRFMFVLYVLGAVDLS